LPTEISRRSERELEEQRQREAELQTYFDDMGDMLLNENSPLAEAFTGDPIRSLARAKTLTILERLDGQPTSKRNVVQFLYESRLIEEPNPKMYLTDADLSEADFSEADLSEADLRGADLSGFYSGANLHSADLSGANLDNAELANAHLSEADLSGANLRSADLRGASLDFADLSGAKLDNADLSRATLRSAQRVTDEELERAAYSLERAIMPDGSVHD
jgi:uncharacterized protein YjbI with pentapeptide repeats